MENLEKKIETEKKQLKKIIKLAEQASKYFFISIKLAEIYYEQTKLYTDLQYSQEERISLLEQETKYES